MIIRKMLTLHIIQSLVKICHVIMMLCDKWGHVIKLL